MHHFGKLSLEKHRQVHGKWEIHSRIPLKTRDDLSIAYTPGVAAVCDVIRKNPDEAYPLTMKGQSVAIVSDGSAVLGLGNLGPLGALPVMEGKAILFKEFGGIDGVPLVVNTQNVDEIITLVKTIAPTFGGINLEDISAPRCFEIENALQDIGIPVFHDDQHGTAIVLLAALINSCKVIEKELKELRVVINGAGAAGTAIARLLRCISHMPGKCISVKEVLVCDSKGIISKNRTDLNSYKTELLEYTNHESRTGNLAEALKGADVFIGVSKGNLVSKEMVTSMNKDPVILAMANPIPEIMPEDAIEAGASIVGTGRSDYPNQVNNVLVFPGIFRGALNAHAKTITPAMKIAAAYALAKAVGAPTKDRILPDPLDHSVVGCVAKAVHETAIEEGVGKRD